MTADPEFNFPCVECLTPVITTPTEHGWAGECRACELLYRAPQRLQRKVSSAYAPPISHVVFGGEDIIRNRQERRWVRGATSKFPVWALKRQGQHRQVVEMTQLVGKVTPMWFAYSPWDRVGTEWVAVAEIRYPNWYEKMIRVFKYLLGR